MHARRTFRIWLGAAIGGLALALPAAAQPVADHLQCYKVKDPQPKAVYTADVGGLVLHNGCVIKVPAAMACVPATATNVQPTPPGTGGTGMPNAFACYKVKCPKAALPSFQVDDQSGTRTVTAQLAKLVCAPGVPTTTVTTSTTTTTSSSTTTTTQCTVYADLAPAGGTRLPQYLTLDASGSYDSCGAPLKYIWACSSGTTIDCPSFEATYNNNGQYDQPVAHIVINELDVIDIALRVCTRDGARCAPEIVNEYIGAQTN